MVLFSMPTILPITQGNMNYAIIVFVGFMVLSAIWYIVYAHKGMSILGPLLSHYYSNCFLVYKGPPESDGLAADT